jgi:hypothetical protein
MSLGIPAVTIGGGGEGGNWHSRNEWYKPVDAYYGPQNALLTVLMLTGLDGVTKPALAVTVVVVDILCRSPNAHCNHNGWSDTSHRNFSCSFGDRYSD